jgi:2-methylcitrate dehydratase PrpD
MGFRVNKAETGTVSETISASVLGVRFEDLDRDTVENAKKRILDIVGDIMGGAGASDNAALVNLVRNWGGKKEASILGYGLKAPAPNAAMVNCILCNSFDSAPLVVVMGGNRYPSHTSGCTVPTAITMGEYGGITGKELITSLVAADDLVSRLQSLNPRGGPGMTPLGAAAIAGRILGLNAGQMKNAFGLALSQSSKGNGGLWDGSPSFKTGYGKAAVSGIIAAQLAKGGWTGPEDPLFGEHSSLFGPDCQPSESLTADLGKKFYAELVFKPYPGCRLTHAGIGAALALVGKHNININDIEEITLILPSSAQTDHCWKPFQIRSYPPGDALFSYRYSIANALLRGTARNEDYTEKSIRDPAVLLLIEKIKLETSSQFAGAELGLKMKDGARLSERMTVAKGDIISPLSRDELRTKFLAQIEFSQVIQQQNAEKLLALLERLEDVESVGQITELTHKP